MWNGERKEWYENNQLKSNENFIFDVKNGLCEIWHENGKLKTQAEYKNVEIIGLEKNWDSSGNEINSSEWIPSNN